jgi:F-type H+-transporting ATPase subunit a
LALVIVITVSLVIKKNTKKVPRGIQNVMEMIIEGFLGIFDGVTGSRKKSLKFAPLVLAFFFFVLINCIINRSNLNIYLHG